LFVGYLIFMIPDVCIKLLKQALSETIYDTVAERVNGNLSNCFVYYLVNLRVLDWVRLSKLLTLVGFCDIAFYIL
jgi:hypothetical protein